MTSRTTLSAPPPDAGPDSPTELKGKGLFLLGAEFDAELQRGRAIAAGHDPTDEPFLELRDDRKIKPGSEQGLSTNWPLAFNL